MPPTIQTGRRDDADRKSRTAERRSELLCRVKYCNTLPDIPFDPKFITYPFEANRYVQYNPTSLEREYKHELLTEHDLGITIDLINPDTYSIDPSAPLDAGDEKLLEEDSTSGSHQDSKRSQQHHQHVSWLRKTMYISSEYNKFQTIPGKAEAQVGFNLKKKFQEDNMYKDRDSQISAIEQTFEQSKTQLTQHYSKPGVKPVETVPVLPDFEMWKHPCAQVIFDSDPAPVGRSGPGLMEEMSQAMIRGMVDESGDQFVAYFLPTEETVAKHTKEAAEGVDFNPEEDYDYMLAREYNWSVKNKFSKGYEECYFFVMKENGCYYNEIETRVRLSKRRKMGGGGPAAKTRLVVKHRSLVDQETAQQDARLAMLEPPQEEEEEIMEPETHDEPKASGSETEQAAESGAEDKKSDGSRSRSSSESSASDDKAGSGSDGGSSDSEAESGDEAAEKAAEEIFGSGSSSDSD